MHIRILVTDYDDCAFSIYSERVDNLSQPIVNMARNRHYDGFYGCTHRTYAFIDNLKYLVSMRPNPAYDIDKFSLNFPTYKITDNFSAATQLPNFGVSIVDDMAYELCGVAYEKVLKPYEVSKQLPLPDTRFLGKYAASTYFTSKNLQLLQIAKHAAAMFPGSEIELDYVDDMEVLCKKAVNVCTSKEWPKNVHLNTFHYVQGMIKPVYEPERFFDASDVVPESWLRNDSSMGTGVVQGAGLFGSLSVGGGVMPVEIQQHSP